MPPGVAVTGDDQLKGNVDVTTENEIGDGHNEESVRGASAGSRTALLGSDADPALRDGQNMMLRMLRMRSVLDDVNSEMAVVRIGNVRSADERHRRRQADAGRSTVLEQGHGVITR